MSEDNQTNSTPPEETGRNVIAVDSGGNAHPLEKNEAPKAAETTESPATTSQTKQTGTPMTEPSKTEHSTAPTVAPVVIKQSGGKGLAAFALLLALLGLGASGFLFVEGQNVLKNQELNVENKLDKAALGESNNAGMLQDTMRKQSQIEQALGQLGGAAKQNSEAIANTQRAYQELLKSRVNWVVDETESTINTAAQQLMLSGNVPVVITVLQSVEGRLSRFEQPELLPIKQAVSSDLAALKNRPYVDISSASLRLNRLETAVASLPLAVDSTLQPGKVAAAAPEPSSASWWENAWDKTLDSLKGLVEVRKLNSSDAMLIAPEQAYFVRENLRLRLLDARTALMQRNGDIYQADLNDAEAAIKQYFDVNSPATQSWLKELGELKALDIRSISDDALKASITAVRNYQDSVRTGSIDVGSAAGQAQNASAPAATSAPAANASAPQAQTAEPEKASAAAASAAKAPAESKQPAAPAQPTQPTKPAAPAGVKGDKA